MLELALDFYVLYNVITNILFVVAENIDEDLQASKKIVDDIQEKERLTEIKQKSVDVKRYDDGIQDQNSKSIYGKLLKLSAAEDNDSNWELKNVSQHQPNSFSNLKENNQQFVFSSSNREPDNFVKDTPQMKFKQDPAPNNKNRHHQFEYRVVTDRPFVHSKTPKAYIAVSLIAPKPIESQEDDFFLENELRELKPWPLHQDYQEPEHIHRSWIKKAQQRNDENDSP